MMFFSLRCKLTVVDELCAVAWSLQHLELVPTRVDQDVEAFRDDVLKRNLRRDGFGGWVLARSDHADDPGSACGPPPPTAIEGKVLLRQRHDIDVCG